MRWAYAHQRLRYSERQHKGWLFPAILGAPKSPPPQPTSDMLLLGLLFGLSVLFEKRPASQKQLNEAKHLSKLWGVESSHCPAASERLHAHSHLLPISVLEL